MHGDVGGLYRLWTGDRIGDDLHEVRRVTFGIVGVCVVFGIVKRVGGVENELGSRKIQRAASKIMSIGCRSEGRWSGYWIWRRKSMWE